MTCLSKNKRGMETLLDHCAGTLDRERSEAIEIHARQCSDCRALIAEQKNLWSALEEMDAPGISADFDERLYARIACDDAQPAWCVWWNRISVGGFSWKPVLACVAAAAILAVGLSLYMSSYMPAMRAPQAQDASRQIRPESVDVEQLELTLQDLDLLTPPSSTPGNTSAGKM